MSGILLHYPALAYYWLTYGTPENPNAGKDAILSNTPRESRWYPSGTNSNPSFGLFQQRESSWGSR